MQKGELDCSLFYDTHHIPTFYPIKYTWQNDITYGLAITCWQRHKCFMAFHKRRYGFNLLLRQSKSKDFSTLLDCCSLLRAENVKPHLPQVARSRYNCADSARPTSWTRPSLVPRPSRCSPGNNGLRMRLIKTARYA